jgi:hypothetical protein
MPTPSDLVTDAFAQANTYATNAQSQLTIFLGKMNDAVQLAPLVDVSFLPVAEPGSGTVDPFVAPADYSSAMLTALSNAITTRLAGGTGLSTSVEAALWDRARERELVTAQAAIDELTFTSEALGFILPTGVLNDGIRRETRAYYDKVSSLSRDIAVEQAKLEQANVQKGLEVGIQYETGLADIQYKRSQVAVDIFRTDVMRFDAEVRQDVSHWEAVSRTNEAIANYTLNSARVNAEIIHANLATLLEVGKTGAQVYAQLAAAAYSLIHASAGVSASASDQVSYSYSNDTTSAAPTTTSF